MTNSHSFYLWQRDCPSMLSALSERLEMPDLRQDGSTKCCVYDANRNYAAD